MLFIFLIYLVSTLVTYFYDVDLPLLLDILYWAMLWPALLFAALITALPIGSPIEGFVDIWLMIFGGLILEAIYAYFLVCLAAWFFWRKDNKK